MTDWIYCTSHGRVAVSPLRLDCPRRLWCVFELAGFLRSHQAQGRLVIKPTILGPATFWNVIAITFVVSTDLVFSGIPGGSVTRFLLVFITTCAVAWPILVWRRGMVTLKRQLAEFTFAKTVCHCCMRGHIDDNGGPIECDRELLGTSICNWFGSVDEFDNLVTRQNIDIEVLKLTTQNIQKHPKTINPIDQRIITNTSRFLSNHAPEVDILLHASQVFLFNGWRSCDATFTSFSLTKFLSPFHRAHHALQLL